MTQFTASCSPWGICVERVEVGSKQMNKQMQQPKVKHIRQTNKHAGRGGSALRELRWEIGKHNKQTNKFNNNNKQKQTSSTGAWLRYKELLPNKSCWKMSIWRNVTPGEESGCGGRYGEIDGHWGKNSKVIIAKIIIMHHHNTLTPQSIIVNHHLCLLEIEKYI